MTTFTTCTAETYESIYERIYSLWSEDCEFDYAEAIAYAAEMDVIITEEEVAAICFDLACEA